MVRRKPLEGESSVHLNADCGTEQRQFQGGGPPLRTVCLDNVSAAIEFSLSLL